MPKLLRMMVTGSCVLVAVAGLIASKAREPERVVVIMPPLKLGAEVVTPMQPWTGKSLAAERLSENCQNSRNDVVDKRQQLKKAGNSVAAVT